MILFLFAPVSLLSTLTNQRVTLSRLILALLKITSLRELLSKGLKYREPKTFTWKQNSTSIMDSVEDYARCWADEEEVEVDTLPKGVESIASLVNRRLSILSATMSARCKSSMTFLMSLLNLLISKINMS